MPWYLHFRGQCQQQSTKCFMQLDRHATREKGAVGCMVTVIPHVITVVGLDELSPANCCEWIQPQIQIEWSCQATSGVQYNTSLHIVSIK